MSFVCVTKICFDVLPRCVVAGSGVLQLPYALNQSGWIGVGLIVFAAFANNYAGTLLIKCLYSNGARGATGRRLKGFSHIGYEAFGQPGKLMVEVFTDAMLLGTLYVLAYVFDSLTHSVFKRRSDRVFYSYWDELGVPVWDLFNESLDGIERSAGPYSIHYVQDVERNCDIQYPEVEASMAEPKKFKMVLSLSMVIISAMYLITAIIGYAAYGSITDSPILNNLPPGIIANSAVFLITAHILFAIPVLVTSFSLSVERRLDLLKLAGGSTAMEERFRIGLRCGLMVLIVGLAMAVPFFKDFMTLLGALANTALIFVFPIVFDFKLFGYNNRTWNEKGFGIVIIVVGVFGGVVGGYEAIIALIRDINGTGGPNKPGGH
ncbi:UNVERIFIED_CONTAM: hypothetical protein HDU68_006671 [Siphonaria sp. JEL0065]|nr:hypothetical protein HDU68_006671 [Siphonaria sp. JEL0065]